MFDATNLWYQMYPGYMWVVDQAVKYPPLPSNFYPASDEVFYSYDTFFVYRTLGVRFTLVGEFLWNWPP